MAMSESDGLSGTFAKVIELCPPCFSASYRPNIKDVGGMQREYSFDAFVIDDSADGECFVNTAALPCDYGASEYLHAYFVALFYAAADIHRVAYFEVRYLFLQTFVFNGIEHLSF